MLCCPTSNAMLAAYLRPDLLVKSTRLGFAEFKSFYRSEFRQAGYKDQDQGNHDAHTNCLQEQFDIESSWRINLKSLDIKASIDAEIPVVVSTKYHKFGHIILVIGYSSTGWYVNDPNGIRDGAKNRYSIVNSGKDYTGAADFYSHKVAEPNIFRNGCAWGRIVHRNKGDLTTLT